MTEGKFKPGDLVCHKTLPQVVLVVMFNTTFNEDKDNIVVRCDRIKISRDELLIKNTYYYREYELNFYDENKSNDIPKKFDK
jgi:CRISPR/Cas system CSM-associated protein Csm4 (group 5 of RAMP superfamily)